MKIFTMTCLLCLGLVSNAFGYGAGAIDRHKGSAYGISYDYSNPRAARARALQECGAGCRVVIQFHNACGAYAADQSAGSTAYGWGIARSKQAAINIAHRQCRRHGGSRCIIRVWGCDR